MIAVDPAEISIACARQWRKRSHGARKVPDAVVRGLYAVYRRTGSLRKAGAAVDRDASTLAYIFRDRGLAMKGRGGANRRLDRKTVLEWYAVYRNAGGLARTSELTGKSENALRCAFHSHRLLLRPRGGRKAKR